MSGLMLASATFPSRPITRRTGNCGGRIRKTSNCFSSWEKVCVCCLFRFDLTFGEDNVPFHTVVFPSTLLGSDQKWTTLNNLSTTEYLNYEGGKFSKSRNLGIFGHHVQEEGLFGTK